MLLVEQHTIKSNSQLYEAIDKEAYKSKNLYNASLYVIRQQFFKDGTYLNYQTLQHIFQEEKQQDYYSLPTKVAQQTMRMVDQNFRSFFNALKSFKDNKTKFKGKPKIPKYLDAKNGRYLLVYTSQAVSKKILKENSLIKLSGLEVTVPTMVKFEQLQQVRVIRKLRSYVIEVVYDDGVCHTLKDDNGRYASIDLGVSNLATVTTNVNGVEPFIIDGRKLKSINRYANKEIGGLKSILDKRNQGKKTSKRIDGLFDKRNNKVKNYMHKASRAIVNQLVSKDISKLVIGYNKGWKQDANMNRTSNQNFVCIPFHTFIQMLTYKCAKEGIEVLTVNESHTSKCSFLDNEEVCHHDKYVGRRAHRGLFKTSKGIKINADVNGSYNILRKCIPNAFNADGVEGVLVHPRIIKILN